ncbi:MAG: L-rhamnose mutarotase [Chitinophaga sp.]|uniref:L-rhamnose mutarotase n=1 Tax=Chitinophaga sp. TaxID=1869181 RepID=UPI001B291348|nr:L-rhamnose mutarotase [Chitinophaga sp.]MBO9728577.1 L-rhamnose mutarotase [Chitinophaga sp.]
MNKHFSIAGISALLVACLLFTACEKATAPEKLTERVFVVEVVPGEQPLKEYLDYHQHIWPEVEAGFRKAGYRNISLYRYQHLLVMTITVPENANLDSMGKIAESSHPRCAEWNKVMAGYQAGVPGTAPGQTWVEASRFYHFNGQ